MLAITLHITSHTEYGIGGNLGGAIVRRVSQGDWGPGGEAAAHEYATASRRRPGPRCRGPPHRAGSHGRPDGERGRDPLPALTRPADPGSGPQRAHGTRALVSDGRCDDVLGRALDKLAHAGPAAVCSAVEALDRGGLHGNSMARAVYGRYPTADGAPGVTPRQGHSRDHRPDGKQILFPGFVNRHGVLLLGRVEDGNRFDKGTGSRSPGWRRRLAPRPCRI